MKIMKFGGTSVGQPQRLKHIAQLVTSQQQPVIVVLSAFSGTTNALVHINEALQAGNKPQATLVIQELKLHYESYITELFTTAAGLQAATHIIKHHFDFLHIILQINYSEALSKDILAQGELLSTHLFAAYLTQVQVPHQLLDALALVTTNVNDEPVVEDIKAKLLPILQAAEHTHNHNALYITQGYICRNAKGEVDNLKRGGSDYTASLIAAAVQASVCEIWTDIDGMHNNDPRVVTHTRAIQQLSFDEAAELAYFGAKILHPASIWPAQSYGVPVKLLNTMQPTAIGTTITNQIPAIGVKAIAAKDNIIAINIKSSRMLLAYGFLRKIFEVFEQYRTPIDMITTSEVAVSLTIEHTVHVHAIVAQLTSLGSIEVEHNYTIVAVVGHLLTQDEDLLASLFVSVKHIPVRMVSYGGSKHNVSLLIPTSYKAQVLQLFNQHLFGL